MLISKATREGDYGANPAIYKVDNPENAIFEIANAKLYVPVVTLSKENDKKLRGQLKHD